LMTKRNILFQNADCTNSVQAWFAE
jgi:hypothetical protein